MAKKAGPPRERAQIANARSVELLWGTPERPSRGPKPGLSVDLIVQAAIGIADAEGLDAVSMQRVASEFGFTPMSLYRYIPGKSELIDVMIDTAVGEPPDLGTIPGGWRPQLAEWARLTWACFQRHRWLLPEAMFRMMGPNQLGWLERAVAALRSTGLRGAELVESVMVVNGFVRSVAPISTDPAAAEMASEWETALLGVLTEHSEQFPALTAAIAEGAFGPDPDQMEFGLQRVLDGVEAYIERTAAQR